MIHKQKQCDRGKMKLKENIRFFFYIERGEEERKIETIGNKKFKGKFLIK